MPPAARIRLLAALAAAVALGLSVRDGWGAPTWWAVPLLAATVTVSELNVVHLSFGRQRWYFSLTEGAIAAAFVYATGSWSVLAASGGLLVALLVRRQERLKVEFNVVQFAAGTALGAGVAAATGGGVAGACAGMGVFWLVNNVMVASAVAIMTRQNVARLLWSSGPLAAVHSAGTASIGLLAAWLSLNAPLGLLGLVVPLVLLWLSYDEQTSRAAEARLFAELARGQERANARSTDISAQVLLTAAARLFGGADVEMVLLGTDGPVRYAGDEYGVSRRRVDPEAFDEPWVLHALGAGGVRTGMEAGRPYCSAVLGRSAAGASPLAVLVARRPAGAAGFGRREAALARVLVGQAEAWLSMGELAASRDEAVDRADAADQAARAIGDLGAHAAPALMVLRDSATRLSRLASTPVGPDPVGDIVGELHAVERAVASLLGAIALAADPELARLGGPAAPVDRAAPSRTEDDWTTTGVLTEVALP